MGLVIVLEDAEVLVKYTLVERRLMRARRIVEPDRGLSLREKRSRLEPVLEGLESWS